MRHQLYGECSENQNKNVQAENKSLFTGISQYYVHNSCLNLRHESMCILYFIDYIVLVDIHSYVTGFSWDFVPSISKPMFYTDRPKIY